jgi:hypothetical protein
MLSIRQATCGRFQPVNFHYLHPFLASAASFGKSATRLASLVISRPSPGVHLSRAALLDCCDARLTVSAASCATRTPSRRRRGSCLPRGCPRALTKEGTRSSDRLGGSDHLRRRKSRAMRSTNTCLLQSYAALFQRRQCHTQTVRMG